MTRPCVCDLLPPRGEAYSTAYCRLCWLYHNDENYKKAWDNSTSQPAPAPSLAQRAVNFARAIYRHTRAGLPVVSENEAKRRISLCEACPDYFDAERRICRHAACGCRLDEKVTWQEQSCPIGKW